MFELKIVVVLIVVMFGSWMSYVLSLQNNPPWYWWVLVWLALPMLIGAFFLVTAIQEKLLHKKELRKRLEKHRRKSQKKHNRHSP